MYQKKSLIFVKPKLDSLDIIFIKVLLFQLIKLSNLQINFLMKLEIKLN
ncbi:hypothetical protein LINPERPRIM_LOCUS8515 [Linum perenne]